MRRSKRQSIAIIHQLMHNAPWWNKEFARYDQKRLIRIAAAWRASVLQTTPFKLEAPDVSFADQFIQREIYKPYVARPIFGV